MANFIPDENAEDNEGDFQVQRTRSPAYPYINLREAVEFAETFFKSHRALKVPASIALKEMGYSSTSGSGVRVIAALTQFELFETDGTKETRKIWLTDLGKTIVWPNPSDPSSSIEAVRDAALRPSMHRWLYDKYELASSSSFPTDEVLEYDLMFEQSFTEKAARAFVKEFKETYEFADLESLVRVDLSKYKNMTTHEPSPLTSLGEGLLTSLSERSEQTKTRELSQVLTKGKIARLVIPSKMSSKDFDLLIKWLQLIAEGELYVDEGDNGDIGDVG